jgi:hypothetical protein
VHTGNAVVRGLKVELQLGVATADGCLFEQRVGNANGTPASTGAPAVGDVQNVGLTTDEAEVGAHAATDSHSSVARPSHDDRVVLGTFGFEHLGDAVFVGLVDDVFT